MREHGGGAGRPGASNPVAERPNVREAALRALNGMELGAAYSAEAIGRNTAGVGAGGANDGADGVSSGVNGVNGAGGGYYLYVEGDTAEDIDDSAPEAVKSGAYDAVKADPRDAALLRELVYGVARWKLTLDDTIFQFAKVKKSRVAPVILNILRLGAYQIGFLDKIPVSAACDECVKLAKKYGNAGSVRFVNAVLRNIASHGNADANKYGAMRDAASLSVRYSYPVWICEKWLSRYGADFTESLLDAGNCRPELTIRANLLQTSVESLQKSLDARGFETAPGRYSKNALIIKNPAGFTTSPEFINGLFTVQDESSMLSVEALRPQKGESIMDACAAPGGKCGYIAEIAGDKSKIYACDLRPQRLAMMEQNLKRLGHNSITGATADATLYDARFAEAMDRVLLDAPCSGLGVIRRKPEIKWAKTAGDILSVAALQSAMLDNLSRYVKPGGALVYSVCTTEPEECEDVVNGFLERNGSFVREDLRDYLPAPTATAQTGGLHIYPNTHGIDGFYIDRLRRVK